MYCYIEYLSAFLHEAAAKQPHFTAVLDKIDAGGVLGTDVHTYVHFETPICVGQSTYPYG